MASSQQAGGFTVQAQITIQAPIEHVWAILTDLEHYGEWNRFVPSMKTTSFEVGSVLRMRVQMSKKRLTTSNETITKLEAPHLLAWKYRSPAWLLGGERFQALDAVDSATTNYESHETFTGIMAPLLKLFYERNLQEGFRNVAADLKKRAEATV